LYKVYLLCEPIFYAGISPTLGLNQGGRVLYKAYLLVAHFYAGRARTLGFHLAGRVSYKAELLVANLLAANLVANF
jgi:hypothetical protein